MVGNVSNVYLAHRAPQVLGLTAANAPSPTLFGTPVGNAAVDTSYARAAWNVWDVQEPTMFDAIKALADALTTGDASVITGRESAPIENSWSPEIPQTYAAQAAATLPAPERSLGRAPAINQIAMAAPAPAPVSVEPAPAPAVPTTAFEAARAGAATVATHPAIQALSAPPAVQAVAAVAPVTHLALRGTTPTARTVRKKGGEVWAGIRSPQSIHVSQVKSKFNLNPAAGNRDCGPASVVMALALLGKNVPGTNAKSAPQAKINKARALAGAGPGGETTNFDLERSLQRAGASTSEVTDMASVRSAISSGKPVILNGNPRNPGAYGHNFGPNKMFGYNGAHWIVVSGMKGSNYIINDPLSKVGALVVTPQQLEAYRGGSLGIVVS